MCDWFQMQPYVLQSSNATLVLYMKVRYSSLIIHIEEEVWEAAEEEDWRWDSAVLPPDLKVQLWILKATPVWLPHALP